MSVLNKIDTLSVIEMLNEIDNCDEVSNWDCGFISAHLMKDNNFCFFKKITLLFR